MVSDYGKEYSLREIIVFGVGWLDKVIEARMYNTGIHGVFRSLSLLLSYCYLAYSESHPQIIKGLSCSNPVVGHITLK